MKAVSTPKPAAERVVAAAAEAATAVTTDTKPPATIAKVVVPPRAAIRRSRLPFVVAVVGLAGFGALFALVRQNRTAALDAALTLQIQAARHPALETAMRAASWPGFPPQSRVIQPVVIGSMAAVGLRLEALCQALAWGTALVSTVVKAFMGRARPVAGTDLRVVAAPLGGSSFPSGHVLTYVGVYGFLAFLAATLVRPIGLRRVIVGGLVSLVALVGPSRIQQGHHWPTDVTASYLLGSSYLVGVVTLYRRLKARSVVRPTFRRRTGHSRTQNGGASPRHRQRVGGCQGRLTTNASTTEDIDAILDHLGIRAEIVESLSPAEARRLAREAAERGRRAVVAVGGDGTIGAVATELIGSETALGVLPGGSIMNIPRMLGIPRDLAAAAQILATGVVRPIDVGEVRGRPFFEAGSVGMNAAMFREAQRFETGDRASIARTIWAAVRYRPARMTIELDAGVVHTRALVVTVSNGPYIGTGMTVAPGARLTTGASMSRSSSISPSGSCPATSPRSHSGDGGSCHTSRSIAPHS